MPDGSMLDFTGRHYAEDHPTLRGHRTVDHREFTGENKRGESLDDFFNIKHGSGSDYMQEFMGRTGAMRVDSNSGVASVMGMPTPSQVRALSHVLRGDYAALSMIDPKSGRIIDDVEIDNPTPQKVARFFANAARKTPDENAPLFSEEPQDRAETMGRGTSRPAPEKTTGIKNAQTAKERAARGLDELRAAGKRSMPQVWDAAEKMLREDPMAGEHLAQEVAQKARALTPEKGVMLAQDRARLTVERHKAADAVNEAVAKGDTAAQVRARVRLFDAGRKLEINDVAGRNSGYEQGLSLAVRRIMATLDYSLEGMESRLQAAKGKPLDVVPRTGGDFWAFNGNRLGRTQSSDVSQRSFPYYFRTRREIVS